MPFIEISLWQGFAQDKKERLVNELTDVTARIVECPKEAVHIIIREEPRENWANAGVQHSKKFPKET
jgi:4-oxalocrotonate tautomerase